MPSQDECREHEARFHQMFPVLSAGEIDRVRRFGEVRRFPAGDLLFRAGETVPEMYVILSGRIATKPYDLVDVNVDIASFDVNLNGKVCGKSNGGSGGKKK